MPTIKAEKKVLSKILQKVEGTISKSSSIEVIKGIYFNGKSFKTTNLEISTEVDITNQEYFSIDEELQIVFPTDFITIVDKLPSGEIEINIDENFKAVIKANGSKFKISCWNGEEFPQTPEVENESVEIESKILKRALEITKVSVSNDNTQPQLTGIHIESNGEKSFFTATNTYKMSNVLIDLGLPKGTKLIIPSLAAKEIINHCSEVENVEVIANESYIKFIFKDVTFISRVIEGNFPNWQQVTEQIKSYDTKIKVDRIDLLEAVKRVNIIARKESSVIALKTDSDSLKIEAKGTDDESIDTVEIELEGENKQINIDANYLIDYLKVLNDDVVNIEVKTELNPMFIQEDKARYLIMPVRPDA